MGKNRQFAERGGTGSRRHGIVGAIAAGVLALGTLGAAAVLAAPVAGATSATTLFVAPRGTSVRAGKTCATATFTTIEAAVTAAATGDTVHVCAGTYTTQVTIKTSTLTLTGTGVATVLDPTSATTVPTADGSVAPIVDVTPTTTGVTIGNLEVGGPGFRSAVGTCGGLNPVGVLYQAASGTIKTLIVRTTRQAGTSGCQAGFGILVSETGTAATPSGSSHVTITHDTVTAFQKNGIACDVAGSDCVIQNNTVFGLGPVSFIAQNGIQVAFTAVASVNDNRVSGIDYAKTGASISTFAAGILLYASGGTLVGTGGQATPGTATQVTGNSLATSQIAIAVIGSDAYVTKNAVTSSVTTSMGVYLLPCTFFCPGLGQAPKNTNAVVSDSTFTGTKVGVWVGYTTSNKATAPTGTLGKVSTHVTAVVVGNTGGATPTVFGKKGAWIVPVMPTGLTGTRTTGGSATLSWTAPTFTGWQTGTPLPLTGYTIVPTPKCAACAGLTAISATATGATVSGLAPSTTYAFLVYASNSAGLGPSSTSVTLAPPPVTKVTTSSHSGYWEVASDGGIFTFGTAQFHGSKGGQHLDAPIVGMAPDAATGGYWEVASDGGIFSFTAPFYGSEGGKHLNAPIVGMAAMANGKGYWEVASDGGIFAFGTAQFHGSKGGQHLNAPIVGMAPDAATGGYWEVASDGGVFSFTAPFYGSEGGKHLNAPIVGMAAMANSKGYWLVASDGGIFTFGTAQFHGSEGGKALNAPIVSMAATANGTGYWEVASDGGIFTFGTATFVGSEGGKALNAPIVGMAAMG